MSNTATVAGAPAATGPLSSNAMGRQESTGSPAVGGADSRAQLESLRVQLLGATSELTALRSQHDDCIASAASTSEASQSQIGTLIQQLAEATRNVAECRRSLSEERASSSASLETLRADRNSLNKQLTDEVAVVADCKLQVAVFKAKEEAAAATAASSRIEFEALTVRLAAARTDILLLEQQQAHATSNRVTGLVPRPHAPPIAMNPFRAQHQLIWPGGQGAFASRPTDPTLPQPFQHYCNACKQRGHRARDCSVDRRNPFGGR